MSAATAAASAPASSGRAGRTFPRGLIIQPLAILAALGAYALWVTTAEITATEANTLAPSNLWGYLVEHLALTFTAAGIVLVIAIPLGVLLTRRSLRAARAPVLAIANIGQAAPAIGLVVLLAFWLGFGFWASVVALVLYAALPVLRNTMLGITGVDQRLIDAGRGMGMSSTGVLLRVELPLAVPLMLAGIRTALVLLVGTATLAAFIDGGGLGILITTGVSLFLTNVLVAGSLLVALLALAIDWLGRVAEHVATPKGLS
ncbi:ABC transporter permease [Litorihabitans aurantiacus]|uniref:ABC transporter permease n=1 Tax=Litorihabitans aurantiacus TaxID=1930061 RepID=A0AA37XF83_9MICO|nr:ABC transporter permease [Litorihabitans aurantiacus]GMA32025.1 ABC transporter permease [Litorihabitans aurantiacus]